MVVSPDTHVTRLVILFFAAVSKQTSAIDLMVVMETLFFQMGGFVGKLQKNAKNWQKSQKLETKTHQKLEKNSKFNWS